MINKTLISVYPSCLSTLAHKDITLKEVYDIIRNDEVLRQRTVNYRKAIDADMPFWPSLRASSATYATIISKLL